MSVQRTKNFIRISVPNTTALVTAVNFVSVKAHINKPRRGNPALVTETDDETFITRLLLNHDDKYFVKAHREKLGYGIYAKPVIDMDGMTCDLATAMQCVGSLGQAIEDAMRWR